MSLTPRPRGCVYCSDRANTLEHVIPKWVPRHFDLAHEVLNQDRAVGISSGQRIPFVDYAAYIYCARHHREVNDLFETKRTHDLLKKLFTGEADTLDGHAQRQVAAWAVKTCYAEWGKARRRRGVPVGHRRHLIETGEPHPQVFVSISRASGDWMRIIFARTKITRRSDGQVFHVYNYVLTLGHLAFKVWGPTERGQGGGYKNPTSFASRVWPPVHEVARWPPGRILDYDAVSELWDYDPRLSPVSGSAPI